MRLRTMTSQRGPWRSCYWVILCSILPMSVAWTFKSTSMLRSAQIQARRTYSVTLRMQSKDDQRQMYMSEAVSVSSLPPVPENGHRFVLCRHGESEFNNANIFTGWCDVALTQRGVVEAVEAGEVFRSHGMGFWKCYTSMLTRSIVTAQRALEAAGVAYTPIDYDWRWNERHYGALQGLSKDRTADRLGRKKTMEWRRSYHARPPLMTPEHPHYAIINEDVRYKHVPDIPKGESLEDCQKRVIEVWQDTLADVAANHGKDSTNSKYSLVVAHANTLRALVMHLDDIPADEIEGLNIPTAIPFYYDVNPHTGEVLGTPRSAEQDNKIAVDRRFSGIYISDERKKRNFLERRRAANDPWLWALHDDQVARSMLLGDEEVGQEAIEGLDGLEEEAKHNTEVFSSALKTEKESRRGEAIR